jgi:hypothetical protein
MITTAQAALLNELIGEDGCYFETIKEDSSINVGTKILFLQRAISEAPPIFLKSLDKLYQDGLDDDESNLELIRSLKTMNDLCFNQQVKFGEHGERNVIEHFFAKLGDINLSDITSAIKAHGSARIIALSETQPSEIKAQQEAWAQHENDILPNMDWRLLVDLLDAQTQGIPGIPGLPPNSVRTLQLALQSVPSPTAVKILAELRKHTDSAVYGAAFEILVDPGKYAFSPINALALLNPLTTEQLVLITQFNVGQTDAAAVRAQAIIALTTCGAQSLNIIDAIIATEGLSKDKLLTIVEVINNKGLVSGLVESLKSFKPANQYYGENFRNVVLALVMCASDRLRFAEILSMVDGDDVHANQFTAIQEIYNRIGATADLTKIIESWNSDIQGEFSKLRCWAMVELTTNAHNRLTIADAIVAIGSFDEGSYLLTTLTDVSEIYGASLEIVEALKSWSGPYYSGYHHKAVMNLMKDTQHPLTIIEAIATIKDMTEPQVKRIIAGETRDQIIGGGTSPLMSRTIFSGTGDADTPQPGPKTPRHE